MAAFFVIIAVRYQGIVTIIVLMFAAMCEIIDISCVEGMLLIELLGHR